MSRGWVLCLADTLTEGGACTLHRIEHPMQALRAPPRRRRLPVEVGRPTPNTVLLNALNLQFDAPSQSAWVVDLNYLRMGEGLVYVVAMGGSLFTTVMGWAVSGAITAQLVTLIDSDVQASQTGGRVTSLHERHPIHQRAVQPDIATTSVEHLKKTTACR